MDYISFYSQHVEGLKKSGKWYQGNCPFHDDQGSKQKGFCLNPENGLWICYSGCHEGAWHNAITFCKLQGLPVDQAPDYDPNYRSYGYPGGATLHKPHHKDKKRHDFWKGPKDARAKKPYNLEAVDLARDDKKTLWICEGAKDAETMLEAGELAAAIPNASGVKTFRDINLDGIPEVIIAFDNDEAGRNATEALLNLFPFAKYVEWPEGKENGYDVTNLKEEDGQGFIETLKGWLGERSLIKFYDYDSLLRDIKQTPEGLKTGFDTLDEIISIPQGAITIVAGRPSHGKTTFLLNMLLNMVRENQEKTFLFFSYEEAPKQVAVKAISILSRAELDKNRNTAHIEQYLKTRGQGENERDDVEGGLDIFRNRTAGKRLGIIGKSYYVEDLTTILYGLPRQYDIGAVFIDYIQKIKIRERWGTRQVELQKISEQLLEVAKDTQMPIIMGCQLGRDKEHKDKVRLDNMREAGDIEQDAHLVLGLHNHAMQKAQDAGEKPMGGEINLKVTVLKNRNGLVNVERTLKFDTVTLTIRAQEPGEL